MLGGKKRFVLRFFQSFPYPLSMQGLRVLEKTDKAL